MVQMLGVVQRGGGTGFPPQTFEGLAVMSYLFGKDFQCYEAAEGEIFGLVDHTHTTAPEFLQDPVVRDGLAQHGRRLALAGSSSRLYRFAGIRKLVGKAGKSGRGEPVAMRDTNRRGWPSRKSATFYTGVGKQANSLKVD
jgi:hypothetical protein